MAEMSFFGRLHAAYHDPATKELVEATGVPTSLAAMANVEFGVDVLNYVDGILDVVAEAGRVLSTAEERTLIRVRAEFVRKQPTPKSVAEFVLTLSGNGMTAIAIENASSAFCDEVAKYLTEIANTQLETRS